MTWSNRLNKILLETPMLWAVYGYLMVALWSLDYFHKGWTHYLLAVWSLYLIYLAGWWNARASQLRETGSDWFRERYLSLPKVEGDILPALGSTVYIHLNRQGNWFAHTVVGYYVWGDLEGSKTLNRVFVRVRDAQGYLNARPLSEVLPAHPNKI